MKAKMKTWFFRLVVFAGLLPSLIFGGLFGGLFAPRPASALSEELINKYDNYQIYFYNAEQKNCVERDGGEGGGDDGGDDGGDSGGGGGGWDGHCSSVSSYYGKIAEFFDTIYSVARNNGLPWEGIVAQLIGESGFMSAEVCPYNPLGLKGSPSCDGKHRTFNSYNEAFNYYVNSIRPVREAMGKFTNDPYGYINFLINGIPGYKYATDPNYVNKISGYVCGVQQWAKANGKPISGSGSGSSSGGSGSSGGSSGGGSYAGDEDLPYCSDDDGGGSGGGGGSGPGPDYSNLIFYNQCDARWRNYNYGPSGIRGSDGLGTICNSGCGPTSFAVIAANLKRNTSITPDKTADLAGKAGMHTPGVGSSWGITKYLAGQYGLTATSIGGTIAAINEYLDNGYMIHTSGKGGAPYTPNGHYIAIVQKLNNGKWLVADSSSRGPSGTYDPATVLAGMNRNNVWAVK